MSPILLRVGGALAVVGLLLFLPSLPIVTDLIGPLPWGTPWMTALGVGLAIAGALLFVQERIPLAQVPPLDRWIGLAILIGAEALRLWASLGSRFTPDYYSYVPALLGVFVMIGGLRILRWAGWPILFLAFINSLPPQLTPMGHMQTMAAKASTYVLQTLGMSAERQGNVILVNDNPLEVAKACSGLSMLTIFGALAFAVALLIERPLWERIVIMLSALPIALAANVLRIVVTGIVFVVFPEQHKLGHDAAGLLVMMPAGLLMLFLEIQILSRIFVVEMTTGPCRCRREQRRSGEFRKRRRRGRCSRGPYRRGRFHRGPCRWDPFRPRHRFPPRGLCRRRERHRFLSRRPRQRGMLPRRARRFLRAERRRLRRSGRFRRSARIPRRARIRRRGRRRIREPCRW